MSQPINNYIGNNTDGQFDPTYAPEGEDSVPINVVHMPMIVDGKQIAGYQATYANGTSKWTAHVHTDSLWDNDRYDNSTFTGSYNDSTQKWTWKPTSPHSIKNLANDWKGNGVDYDRVTKQQVKDSFYNKEGVETTQKRFSGMQANALVQEKGSLTALKEDEKFSKLPGVQGTSTENIPTTNSDGSNTNDPAALKWKDVLDLTIPSVKVRKQYGNYYYPYDLGSNKQDRIIFTMKQSTGKLVGISKKTIVKSFQRQASPIAGSVTLPIQAGIKDLNSVDWQGSTMNPLQAFGAAAALNMTDAAKQEGKTVMGEAEKALKTGAALMQDKAIGQGIDVWLAGQAVQTRNLLSRTTGAIANPNMELLFNAPGLRAFDFTFQMSPRDSNEAKQVKSIINFFKQGMSVKTTSTNVYLKAPNYFEISYMTFDNEGKMIDHPSISRIKTCALLSCAVDYTPNNSYMTYSDASRSMVAYSLNLQFNELDPLYEEDYFDTLEMKNTDAPSTEIGY